MASIISELFIKFGGSSAALERATERVKLNVKQTAKEIRKETGQARDATELLGRTFGVQLPAQVQKFLASSSAIRPALAAAFNIAILGGFAAAVIAIIPKIKEVAEVFGGLTQETKEWARELVKANDALLLTTKIGTMQLLSQVNDELEEINRRVQEGATAFGGQFDPGKPDSPREVELRRRQLMLAERLNELDRIAAKNRKVATDRIGEMFELTQKLNAARARSLSLLPELTPQGPIGEGGIFSFLRGLDQAEQAVFARFAQQTTQDIFARGRVGKFADFDRELKKANENMALFKRGIESAFDSFEVNLTNAAVQWRGFSSVFLDLLAQIQNALLKTFVISPLVGFLEKGLAAFLGRAFSGGNIKVGGLSFPPVPTPPIPRQFGGPAFAGQPLLVGEGGPEIFVPHTGGQIVPNGKVGGGNIIFQPGAIDARGGAPGIEHRIVEAVRLAMRATRNAAVADVREISVRSL